MMKIKVYRFKMSDAVSGGYLISLRLATRPAIEKINAGVVENTRTQKLKSIPSTFDSEGFTTIDFLA